MRGEREKLKLGNLSARRDWGFAGDYVEAMHGMLQQRAAKDYVVGTGESHSVAEFAAEVLSVLAAHSATGDFTGPLEDYVEVDPRFLRPNEIHDLRADASLARRELGWRPKTSFQELVRMMVESELTEVEKYSVAAR